MKTTMYIELPSIDVVKHFVNDLAKMDGDFDLIAGRYVIDAKSLVSMLALVHTPGLKLDIHGEKAGNVVNILKQEGFCEVH